MREKKEDRLVTGKACKPGCTCKRHSPLPRSKESRRKQSESMKGHFVSDETRKKRSRPCSEETKAKISGTLQGHPVSDETKKKISDATRGKIISSETRAKLSKTNTGREMTSRRSLSDETKKKIGDANRGKSIPRDIVQKTLDGRLRHQTQGLTEEQLLSFYRRRIWQQIETYRVRKLRDKIKNDVAYLYVLVDELDQVRYVGQTIDPERRLYEHLYLGLRFRIILMSSRSYIDEMEDSLIVYLESKGTLLLNKVRGGRGIMILTNSARREISRKGKERWANRTPEERREIGLRTSKTLKGRKRVVAVETATPLSEEKGD